MMACHGATKVSPYHLIYGYEAVLPWELKPGSWRVTFQNQLTADEYSALMKDELEDLAGHQLKVLINVEANKARVSRWYDKKVKAKTFEQGELVWKLILHGQKFARKDVHIIFPKGLKLRKYFWSFCKKGKVLKKFQHAENNFENFKHAVEKNK